MNIYLLNIGYIIGVYAVAVVITYLIDMMCYESISENKHGGLVVSLLIVMLSTIMLLLSYY